MDLLSFAAGMGFCGILVCLLVIFSVTRMASIATQRTEARVEAKRLRDIDEF